jgi:hypothetical protein
MKIKNICRSGTSEDVIIYSSSGTLASVATVDRSVLVAQ